MLRNSLSRSFYPANGAVRRGTSLKAIVWQLLPSSSSSASSPLVLLPPRRNHSTGSPKGNKNENEDLVHPSLVKDPPISSPSSETDPWSLKPPPLPTLPKSPYKTVAEIIASPHPEGRDHEPTEVLRKRLVYESRKRGILEMDLILGTFARTRLETMTDGQLREYDRFLTLPDWSIYYYVTNKAPAPEPWKSSWILSELLAHARNEGRSVRRMPDLPNRAPKEV